MHCFCRHIVFTDISILVFLANIVSVLLVVATLHYKQGAIHNRLGVYSWYIRPGAVSVLPLKSTHIN